MLVKKILKIIQFISILTTIVWLLAGLLTIGSLLISTIGILINISVGVFFILIGIYIYLKFRYFLIFLTHSLPKKADYSYAGILITESIFFLVSFSIGIVILYLVWFRTFYEGLAVLD